MDLKDKLQSLIDQLKKEQHIEAKMEHIFGGLIPLIEKLKVTIVELRDEEDNEIRDLEKRIDNVLTSLSHIAEKRIDELNPMFKEVKRISKEDAMKIEDVQNVFLKLYKHLKVLDQGIEDIVSKPVTPVKLKEIQDMIHTIHEEFHRVMEETQSVEEDVERKAA